MLSRPMRGPWTLGCINSLGSEQSNRAGAKILALFRPVGNNMECPARETLSCR